MKKLRVFELAKNLSIDSKELLKIAKDLAISVENNMSMLDVHDIDRIKRRVTKETVEQQEQKTEDTFVQERVSSKVIRRRARVQDATTQAPLDDAGAPGETPVRPEAEAEGAPTTTPATETEPVEEAPTGEAPAVVATEEAPAPEITLAAAPTEEAAPQQEPAPPVTPEEPAVEQEPAPTEEVAVEQAPAPAEEAAPAKPAAPQRPAAEEKPKKKEKKKGKKVKEEPQAPVVETVAKKPAVKGKEKQVYTQSDLYGDGRQAHGKKGRRGRAPKRVALPVKHKKIRIDGTITVANLARDMGLKAAEVIKSLMGLGVMASINQYLSAEEALLVAAELGFEVEEVRDDIREDYLTAPVYAEEDLSPRPPVVTVMGHVDHGKTSLLDAIRQENVTESESGGITQHIGAYQAVCKGKPITFIDTPGHEAFTSMRARGAQVTDFVVLVVAADDGVMEQTKEAINHARAAEIPIIVAVNKIDKANANPQRVKEQLTEFGLVPEEWGGETIFVDVSAKEHTGIEDLLEMIQLEAEMLDIKSAPSGDARGIILESKLDKNRGPMCTILVQHGVLSTGDVFVVGGMWGKARAMYDFRGRTIKAAPPGTPVELIGLNDTPSAGDDFFVVPNEKKAKEITAYLSDHEEIKRLQGSQAKAQVTLEDLYSQVMEGALKELNLIVKGDVHGTVEAIVSSIQGIETGAELCTKVIHSGVGGITENDILLASTSKAIVIGFNVRPETTARELARKYHVDIKLYSVIYDLLEDIKQALKGMLEPVFEEVVQGRAEVRDTFKVPKMGVIAGCMVLEGKITRGAKARLLRDNVVVHDGSVDSLRRFKDDAKEVAAGYECGIGLANFNDIKLGDVIEVYFHEERERETPW